MSDVKFDYHNKQGKSVDMSKSPDDIAGFEMIWKMKIAKHHGESLVNPVVHVIVTDDAAITNSVQLIADGKLIKY